MAEHQKKYRTHFGKVDNVVIDPIMQIMQTYMNSKCEDKVNLTVGAYRDENLKTYVFPSIRKAEIEVIEDTNRSRAYMHPLGDLDFARELARLFYSDDSEILKNQRIFSCQSISGTGALRVFAEFVSKYGKPSQKTVYIPDPTWPNHNLIFENAGFNVVLYNFYDPKQNGIDFEYLINFLENAIEGSTILFHTCAFNPTGCDLTKDQWNIVGNLVKKRNLYTILDTAYQGFASGDLEEDIYPIKLFTELDLEFSICQSLSKNMGLYGERAGGLHIVFKDQGGLEANKLLIKKLEILFTTVILSLYLTPVDHGSNIIKQTLKNYKEEWKSELKHVVTRLIDMRKLLFEELVNIQCPGDWKHILNQKGMFAYTGLTVKQCEYLIEEKKVFLVKSGRISVCGLNKENVKKVAESIKEAILKVSE